MPSPSSTSGAPRAAQRPPPRAGLLPPAVRPAPRPRRHPPRLLPHARTGRRPPRRHRRVPHPAPERGRPTLRCPRSTRRPSARATSAPPSCSTPRAPRAGAASSPRRTPARSPSGRPSDETTAQAPLAAGLFHGLRHLAARSRIQEDLPHRRHLARAARPSRSRAVARSIAVGAEQLVGRRRRARPRAGWSGDERHRAAARAGRRPRPGGGSDDLAAIARALLGARRPRR